MLEASDVECVRGDRVLFSGLSFTLQRGEILHVNGPNGSGKTTLLRSLCGLMTPAGGEVRWCGRPIKALGEEYFKDLVYLGHLNAIKDDLTALENLVFSGGLSARPVTHAGARAALARFGLEDYDDLPVRLLSQGQRRRVALSRLLTGAAALWILDEPFTALDSGAVRTLQEIIRAHALGGGLAVMTTHQEVRIADATVRHVYLAA